MMELAPMRLNYCLAPDAALSLQRLKGAGFILAVITNQPDVGHGLIARSEVDAMHDTMTRELPVDVVKACFHRQGDGCNCRKPKPGMILEAAVELGVNLNKSSMVGDRSSDVEAGRAAGCATVFIDLGYDEPAPDAPDYVGHSIMEVVKLHLMVPSAKAEESRFIKLTELCQVSISRWRCFDHGCLPFASCCWSNSRRICASPAIPPHRQTKSYLKKRREGRSNAN